MTYKKKHFWIVFIVLIFATLLRICSFSGMGFDDLAYVKRAHYLLYSGDYFNLMRDHYAVRIGLVFPIALFQAVLGINELSSVLFPLICSLGTIFVVYLIGSQLFNKNVGLIAAFLLSFLPQHVALSTRLFPNSMAPLFVALAFYFLLKQEKVDSERIKYILCILCGFFLFWAFQIREISIIFFLVCLIYVLLQRRMRLRYTLIPLSFLVFVTLLYLFYYKMGNFLWQIDGFKYHDQILRDRPTCYTAARTFETLEWMFPLPAVLSRATSLNYFVKDFVYSHYVFGFFYYFFLIALIYSFIRHKSNKQYIILVIWFLVFLLYLEFGSTSLRSYSIVKRDRFLGLISPPAVLITALGIQTFITSRKRKITCATILFFLLVSSTFYIRIRWPVNFNSITEKYRTTFSFLKSADAKNIFVSHRWWSLKGEFYYKYRKDVKFYLLDEYKPEEVEGYIVIDRDFKESFNEIPKSWQFMRRFGNATVYKTMGMGVRKNEDIIKR